MPKGSQYPGPPDRLDDYRALVERHSDAEVKGAKNPYTSLNGWMTSFLDPDGLICLRLAEADRVALIEAGGAEVEQYGRTMGDFASLPANAADGDRWFAASWVHTATLEPK